VDIIEIGGMDLSLGRLGTPRTINQIEYDNLRWGRRERNVGKQAILRKTNRRLSRVQRGVWGKWEKKRGVNGGRKREV
jgi:hypothetical protein